MSFVDQASMVILCVLLITVIIVTYFSVTKDFIDSSGLNTCLVLMIAFISIAVISHLTNADKIDTSTEEGMLLTKELVKKKYAIQYIVYLFTFICFCINIMVHFVKRLIKKNKQA